MNERKQRIDFEMKRFIGLVVVLLLTAAVVGVLVRASFRDVAVAPPDTITKFAGGRFEASGVVHVPGSAAVLFVDDDRTNEVFWMPLGADRKQSGVIKRINIATNIIDLEGITTDGEYFYVVGSQSKSEGADQAGLARFKFDAANQRAEGTQTASGLKKFLADNVAELRDLENTNYEKGGINVEGIAWDPVSKRLLLGLRSPVIGGQALVVPLKLRDPKAALSFENLEVEAGKAIRLSLGGAGIRSIDYDETRKAFYVITGAGPDAEKIDFKIWEWTEPGATPALREVETINRRLKPEGITRVSTGSESFTFIVFDTSGYAARD